MGSYYPSKQPGVSDGMDTGAPHSRLMLPDCWWCSFCCPQTGLGMLSQRQVCVRVQVAGKGALGLPLSHEDSFHRRERSQPPNTPSAGPTGGHRKGGGEQEGLPGRQCPVLGGAQAQRMCELPGLPESPERLRGLLSWCCTRHDPPRLHTRAPPTSAGTLLSGDSKQPTPPQGFPMAPGQQHLTPSSALTGEAAALFSSRWYP